MDIMLLYYFGRFDLPATIVRHLFESKGSCKLLRQEEAYFGLSFSMESTKTFDLKVNIFCCDDCKKKLKKLLKEIGVEYDINLEQEKVTISGTVDPDTIIKKIKKEMRKTATLWPKESPPALNNIQNMQIVQQKPIQEKHMVAQRPKSFELHQGFEHKLTSREMSTTKKTQSIHRHEHEHEFEPQSYEKRFPCNGCKEDGFGSRHRCKCCDYELHNECKNPQPTISHDFFKGYTFTFFEKLPEGCGDIYCKEHPRYCSACGKEICGFVYHCKEKGWNLHPCCSSLPTKRCIDGMSFELRNKASSKCMRCNHKVVRCGSKSVPCWSYVCTSEPEGYQFHVCCVIEMVHEAWKKGAVGNIDSNALEKISLRLVVNSKRKDRKVSQFLTTLAILLKTIVGILLGDPTAIVAPLFVELVLK
ncbi:hypothetical protein F0562_031589 [Nyssa sinensis]|uniref:Phorbol-ester/DAG-type domain-containing protein n=1 Tax=Nyssa sinensis TaxID=561372 RepID=A0A5J5AVB5_9ASTE|nr:hypothetical protein F0562_031589 [Nyssa sinensis]